MSRIWYDWEFLEDGRTIEPISIGMVAEDGRELYLINADAPLEDIREHPWLMENVVSSLPIAATDTGKLFWNSLHPDYERLRYRNSLASAVLDFIRNDTDHNHSPDCLIPSQDHDCCPVNEEALGGAEPDDPAELWGWYPAYDHVVLCQLWGTMMDRPPGIPMQTFDVHQEAVRLGNPEFPDFPVKLLPEHHALADALECKARHEWLIANYDRKQYCCPDILREPGRPHEGPCLR